MFKIIECYATGKKRQRCKTNSKEIAIIHYNYYNRRNIVSIYESCDNFKTEKEISIQQLKEK